MAGIEKPSRVVVLDAGPLIHLDDLGSLGLLADHVELLVPDAVWNEVEQHRPALFVSSSLYFRRTTPRSAQDPSLAAISILYPLHLGETQALQIAMECEADMLLTDDTAARLAANQLRIPVHGTLGILLRAVRTRQLSTREVVDLLQALPERSTLHVRSSLLKEIIAEVDGLNQARE
jgi:predicted nucleic acid-binding protein